MVKETETAPRAAKKVPVAEITLLKSDGSEATKQEEATGFSYKLIANSKTFTWQKADANENEILMLAIFGGGTLATNETSAIRNRGGKDRPDLAGDADEQFDALTERFTALRDGSWTPPDRTREGPRVDTDKLASAIVAYLVASGKRTDAEAESEHARQLGKLNAADTGKAYVASSRQIPEVAANYATLMGKKVATLDDLMA